jgi:hypothetical protein
MIAHRLVVKPDIAAENGCDVPQPLEKLSISPLRPPYRLPYGNPIGSTVRKKPEPPGTLRTSLTDFSLCSRVFFTTEHGL